MKHHLQRAFTLIEILVALAVGGVVASLGVVTYTKIREGAHDSKVKADAITLNRAIDVFLLTGGSVPAELTAKDVIQLLKSVPSAQLQTETAAFRLLGDESLGINPYTVADGRMRLIYAGGRFSATSGGDGWLLDKSGNVRVTEESRQVYGMKFGKQSKWLWDTNESSAGPKNPGAATLSLTTTAPFDGTNYRITAPGSYGFTTTTTAVAGTLGLQVGPYSKTTEVTAGAQTLTQPIAVGPGAHFTIVATAALAATGANQTKQLTVIVDVPGTSIAVPKTLEVVGSSAVSVRASEGTHHEDYTYLLTYSDGTISTGPISNPAQGNFTWRADVPSEVKVISDTQKGLTASKNVVVTYVPQFTVTITAQPAGSGTASVVSPDSSGKYDAGTVVGFSAAPNTGFTFAGWSGDASGSSASSSATVDHNLAITANFAAAQYRLAAAGSTGGTVTVSTAPASVGGDGFPRFAAGTVVTVVAAADAGYAFSAWGGTNGGSVMGGSTGTIVMDSDKAITGTFTASATPTFSLSVVLSDPAAGSANGSATGLSTGDTRPVSITLNPGYEISSVNITGAGASLSGSGTDNSRTATIGTADATVTYAVNTVTPPPAGKYNLSTSVSGSGTVSGAGAYDHDTSATLNPSPAAGWNFSHWAGSNGGDVSGSTIFMNSDKSVQAVFVQKLASTHWAAAALGGSGNYKFTSITITAVGDSAPTFSQSSSGGFAEVTAELPIGNYNLSADIEDNVTGEKAHYAAQIEVVDN